jgi:glyceraldehyde 3-phosphate dehydrogenase
VEENQRLIKAAADGGLKGILAYNDAPLVSVDFNHDPALLHLRCDADQGHRGHAGEGLSWYDNEWGFSNRMLDTTVAWSKAA